MPEISIIVPVYRAEAFLPACIDSILAQTFRDFVLYLVDDGSPDNCGAICDAYAQRDSRIRVIHQENGGQAAARNRALALANTTWVCFVDSDDLIHPQMVQRLYDGAVGQGAGISMCPMVEATDVPEHFYREPQDTLEVLPMGESTLVSLYDRGEYPSWVACAKLIRREYVEKHRFCTGRVYEDNEAVCHWMYQTEKLVRLPDAMYFYRTNPNSTTQQPFSLKKLDYLWALEQIIRFYDAVSYGSMKERFAVCYGEELVCACSGLRFQLNRVDLMRQVEKQARRFAREQRLPFSEDCRQRILEVTHPKWMPLYWPIKGAIRRVRASGLWGLVDSIRKKAGKGEGP